MKVRLDPTGTHIRHDVLKVRMDFYPDLTDKTGEERFHEVESTGAQIVLTACPACVTQLQYTRGQLESPTQVMDIISLVKRVARWK